MSKGPWDYCYNLPPSGLRHSLVPGGTGLLRHHVAVASDRAGSHCFLLPSSRCEQQLLLSPWGGTSSDFVPYTPEKM